tara:strand:- start:264 stop:419 length:156 start_codon:yes stop_codon:yes gene_type:complete
MKVNKILVIFLFSKTIVQLNLLVFEKIKKDSDDVIYININLKIDTDFDLWE